MDWGIQVETLPINIRTFSSCLVLLRLRHPNMGFWFVSVQSMVWNKIQMFILGSSWSILSSVGKLDRSTRHESCKPPVAFSRWVIIPWTIEISTTIKAFANNWTTIFCLFLLHGSCSTVGFAIPWLLRHRCSKRSPRHSIIRGRREIPINSRICIIGGH